jgi:hypothetical protein
MPAPNSVPQSPDAKASGFFFAQISLVVHAFPSKIVMHFLPNLVQSCNIAGRLSGIGVASPPRHARIADERDAHHV